MPRVLAPAGTSNNRINMSATKSLSPLHPSLSSCTSVWMWWVYIHWDSLLLQFPPDVCQRQDSLGMEHPDLPSSIHLFKVGRRLNSFSVATFHLEGCLFSLTIFGTLSVWKKQIDVIVHPWIRWHNGSIRRGRLRIYSSKWYVFTNSELSNRQVTSISFQWNTSHLAGIGIDLNKHFALELIIEWKIRLSKSNRIEHHR